MSEISKSNEGRNVNILVVDDATTMRLITKNLLGQIGFNLDLVDDASDGNDALSKLEVKKYDLVISDWNMEPMTGLELLKIIRGREDLKSIPFIMLTAESKIENVIAAKTAGVNNYIVKPFTAETLEKKIGSVIRV